jgi:tRNA(fMet)-specific endonuclease VapC
VTSRYLLDTDIVSYLIRRHDPGLEARFKARLPSSICVSAVTRAELMYGLKGLPQQHRLQVDVPYFLGMIRVLPWDEKCADLYAEIRHHLTRSGNLIGELDMMIAANAMAIDAVLVTNNTRHFERILMPLKLENWAS